MARPAAADQHSWLVIELRRVYLPSYESLLLSMAGFVYGAEDDAIVPR